MLLPKDTQVMIYRVIQTRTLSHADLATDLSIIGKIYDRMWEHLKAPIHKKYALVQQLLEVFTLLQNNRRGRRLVHCQLAYH